MYEKKNAGGMNELHQLPQLKMKMMLFLDVTEKEFSIFGSEVSNCHVTAKSSLRDQTLSLIRLHEGYVRSGFNVKSSNETLSLFPTVINSRRSAGMCSCRNQFMASRACKNEFFSV